MEYSREVYVEQTDLCDLNYTYRPNNEISISEIKFTDRNYLTLLKRDLNLDEVKQLVLNTNKNYKCTSPLNQEELNNLIIKNPLINDNVVKYNDIAYYLGENNQFDIAIYLLEIILKKYPDRVVAWLNYGDSLWKINDKSQAKIAYQNYISLMKSQKNNLSKVPQRVYERI